MKLLKWRRQEKHYSCLPACLKMIFEYYGIRETELALRVKCKSKVSGTHPLNAVECCRYYGLESYIDLINIEGLKNLLEIGIFPIVNIFKFEKDIWYVHSVIVHKIEDKQIEIFDPEEGIMNMPIDKFDQLWQFADRVVIVIKKPD